MRANLAAGATATDFASQTSGDDGQFFVPYATIDPRLLLRGDNVLAVEVHQAAANSSDISFDARLVAQATLPTGVLQNDSDVDGDAFTASLVAGPQHGSVELLDTGEFTYVPQSGYIGADGFSYRTSDGSLDSTPVTVAIDVKNTPPLAASKLYHASEDALLEIPATQGVLGGASDAENQPLVSSLLAPPRHGSLTLRPDGSLRYAPASGYVGPDEFLYRVFDGFDYSDAALVRIIVEPQNDAPEAATDVYATAVNQPLTIPPLAPVGTPYSTLVMGGQPRGYWRLDEVDGSIAADAAGDRHGTNVGGVLRNQ
jgi:hypothetical protein